MSKSNESAPLVEPLPGTPLSFEQRAAETLPPATEIDPDNPPWGLLSALLTWLGSVALLVVIPLLFLIPYAIYQRAKFAQTGQSLLEDKTALFLAVLSNLPVHILTFGLVWAVVTRLGKRPFWSALGWSWSKRVGFWTSAGLAVLLLGAGAAFTNYVHGEPTEIDKLFQSSTATRFTLAILAATTGPLVEELVYRGVLYPTLQRAAGMFWAVVGVSILFTLPHVPQYYNNVAVIAVVFALSISLTLVRAYTGRLLPCFIMHLVFNGIQSVIVIFEPYVRQMFTKSGQGAAVMRTLPEIIRPFF